MNPIIVSVIAMIIVLIIITVVYFIYYNQQKKKQQYNTLIKLRMEQIRQAAAKRSAEIAAQTARIEPKTTVIPVVPISKSNA